MRPVSLRQLLADTVRRFEEGGVDEPGVSARRILEQASGWDGAELAVHLDDSATVRMVAYLDAMVARRLRGEPVQYVVGRWGFRTLDLLVDHRVLIPRPETEEVAGLAIDRARRATTDEHRPVVVDLGTGSGAIGLSVAVEVASAVVHLTEVSSDAMAVARANLTGIGRAAPRVTAWEGSWFEALPTSMRRQIDVVVSNPPYVPDAAPLPDAVADWEPTAALRAGPDGLDALHHLVDTAIDWLAEGGSLVLETGEAQTGAVAHRCGRRGYEQVQVHRDLAGRPRAVVAIKPGRPRSERDGHGADLDPGPAGHRPDGR